MTSGRLCAGCLLALVLSLAAVSAADAATLRLDSRFGQHGVARVPFRLSQSAVDLLPVRAARQRDGKLLVAAAAGFEHQNSQFLIARFTRRGKPDPTFGHGGWTHHGLRWNFTPQTVHVQRDGRILVLGAAGRGLGWYPTPGQVGLARLLPDGSLDRTFGRGGFVTWNPPWRADTVFMTALPALFAPQANGKVLAASVVNAGAGRPLTHGVGWVAFGRFNGDGSVDRSFGRDGVAEQLEGPDSAFFVYAWAALHDGHIAAVVRHNHGFDEPTLWLHRFTPDGAVDSAFGENGALQLDTNGLADVSQVLAYRDGSLVLIGHVAIDTVGNRRPALRRILPGGQLDSGFATGCRRSPLDFSGAVATPGGGLLATTGFGNGRLVSYDAHGCRADRPVRTGAALAGPPLLLGRHSVLVAGASFDHELTLTRIRRGL